MATFQIFMLIDGIAGSSRDANHADYCDVRGLDHVLEYPYDMSEGEGRGKPQHGALEITKVIDKATPLLAMKLARMGQVPSVEIEFTRDDPASGDTVPYYRIQLKDCRVVKQRTMVPVGNADPTQPAHLEVVGFAYREIIWTFEDGGIEGGYNFNDPAA
jgi:type VI secretion system Hcp family effector